MPKTAAALLLAFVVFLPATARSQSSKPPLPALGPRISDLGLETRLNEAAQHNSEAIATLEFSYLSSGDLRTVMKKTNPQGLFVTVEVNGSQVKNIARNKKLKVAEAVEAGRLRVKARWSRPGKRLETECTGETAVGFQQVIFLPYGGDEGYFSCQVLPRLLPDDVVAEWKDGFEQAETEAFRSCAASLTRGSTSYWTCIESAGIPFPLG